MPTIDWAFLCERIDVDPDDHRIISMVNIIRPGPGFGFRRLPLTLRPAFGVALRGHPRETVTIEVVITLDGKSSETPAQTARLSGSGMSELMIPCGTLVLLEPRTVRFALKINGEVVFSTNAPVARERGEVAARAAISA